MKTKLNGLINIVFFIVCKIYFLLVPSESESVSSRDF